MTKIVFFAQGTYKGLKRFLREITVHIRVYPKIHEIIRFVAKNAESFKSLKDSQIRNSSFGTRY